MHKTIYIEADEEITSIVDRIKKEGSPDIFLVVPKNAMLVQGVINLKLLKKESEKSRKNIILVTNDKQAKKVIGRIGFEIKEALSPEEIEEVLPEKELDEIDRTSIESVSEIEKQESRASGQRNIGTPSFFAEEESSEVSEDDEEDILNDNIQLNTQKSSGKVMKRMDMTRGQESAMEQPPKNSQLIQKKEGLEKRKLEAQEVFKDDIDFDGDEFQGGFSDKKAEEFFTRNGDGDNRINLSKKSFKKKKSTPKKTNGKFKFVFAVMMIVFLAFIGFGGWAYFNWPQMNVVIYPNEKNVISIVDVDVREDLSSSDVEEGELDGKMEEIEIEKTLEFDATGEKYSSDQGKARGKVVIYNNYSSADQPLVKTTRVLSEDGRLFRLINSVTVPGMDGEEPGKIEVKVIADEPGEDFNIGPSSFTIEGFKGGPKYEGFKASSESTMTGGSESSDNNLVKYVTESDIEKARIETLEGLEKSFEQELSEKIDQSRGYILDSAKKEVVGNESSFEADEVTDKFNYTIKQKVRIMTFAKVDLLEAAKSSLISELDSGYELDENEIRTEIIKDVTDFENNTMSLKIDVSGIAWPKIDQDNFKKGVADQKEEDFQEILRNYQEIKKVDIDYNPGFLSGMSVAENKINISIKKELGMN